MSQNVQKLILQASTRIGAGIGNAQTKLFANIKSVRVIRKIDARAHQTPDNDSLLNIDEKKPFHIACVGRWVELSATWYVTTTPCCVAYSLHTTYACVDDIDSEMLGCMYTHACIPTLTNALCRVNSQQVCRHAVAQSSGWVPQLQMDSVGSVQHLPAPCSLVGDARNRWLQVRTELQTVGVARSASCKCVPCLVASLSFTHQACMASRPFTHRACMVSLSYLSAMHTWCVHSRMNACSSSDYEPDLPEIPFEHQDGFLDDEIRTSDSAWLGGYAKLHSAIVALQVPAHRQRFAVVGLL